MTWEFVIDLTEKLYEFSGLKCFKSLAWSSVQSLEEKEHVIRIMTENASWFVKLIVKECVNRNPVRVWSLFLREATII